MKIKIPLTLITLSVISLSSIHAQQNSGSIWLRTNYNFSTQLQRNPSKPEDGQTQMPFNQGIGIGISHIYPIANRWSLESNLSYQKKGFRTKLQVGVAFGPPEINGYSELTLSDNYHYLDLNETIWFKIAKTRKFGLSIGAGIGIGNLISYKKGSDFWLMKLTSAEHTEYINAKPNPFSVFRYAGIEAAIGNRFMIGFDNKNDIGRFIKTDHFETKNWVWSITISYSLQKQS